MHNIAVMSFKYLKTFRTQCSCVVNKTLFKQQA